MKKYNTIALIVAAGSGERFKHGAAQKHAAPKQYLPLGGIPMLRHSILTFLGHPQIDAVYVVYNPEHQELYDNAVGDLPLEKPIAGGATRQESVRLGLEAIVKHSPKKVLIHDAARPLVDNRIITDIINSLDKNNAVIPAIPVEDTIKKCTNGKIITTIPRENLMRAQTPQGFVFERLMDAMEVVINRHSPNFLNEKIIGESNLAGFPYNFASQNSGNDGSLIFTDDASLFEHLNKEVCIIPGAQNNFKITTNDDLKRAEMIMSPTYETRIGSGFDVHKFCAPKLSNNNFIMICGVKIPHDQSLEGHSDADVGLHATVDALLGTIAAGDIGTHFSPTDMRWKDADSSIFLAHAHSLLKEKNAEIINIDITIICEKPKILPHREKMCETIAKILGIEQSRISVKATTTEGMGFTGRKEGIAAQAVTSVRIKT